MRDFDERRFGKNFYRLVTTCNGRNQKVRVWTATFNASAFTSTLPRSCSTERALPGSVWQRRKFDCSHRLGIDLQGEALPQPG
jgi:hypothetical protein